MYKIRTEFEFEAAHQLFLNYDSPCTRLHGHSYRGAVTLASDKLDVNGMIVDFKIVKKLLSEIIDDQLDHRNLNDVFVNTNATAEFMSRWICEELNYQLEKKSIEARCVCVELNETTKNRAIWEVD